MRSRLTACKLLLIVPALFLMLQVSLALHHHQSNSYHDDRDYFHSVSTSVDKQFSAIDGIIDPLYLLPIYRPLITATIHYLDHTHVKVAFTTPSHSRAPPTIHA